MKHEHLLEGIIAAEKKEVEEEEAALTAMASKIFEEKRSTLRKLEDDETGVINEGVWLVCMLCTLTDVSYTGNSAH